MPTKTTDLTPNILAARRYADRWRELRDIGHKPVILNGRTHPENWAKWRSYFKAHGLMASYDLMNDGRVEITVPTLDPASFIYPEPLPVRRPYSEA